MPHQRAVNLLGFEPGSLGYPTTQLYPEPPFSASYIAYSYDNHMKVGAFFFTLKYIITGIIS